MTTDVTPSIPDPLVTPLTDVVAQYNALQAQRDQLQQANAALTTQVASLTAQVAQLTAELSGGSPILAKQFIGITPPADTIGAFNEVQSRVGKLGGRSLFRQWGWPVPKFTAGMDDDGANGRVTLVRIKPPVAAPAGWQQVAAGGPAIDNWLTTVIKASYALNPRLMVCFHHEPIEDAPNNAADFVAASNHFYDVVKAAAPNAVVGPIFMLYWDLQPASGHHLSDWIPAKYDYIGGDPYPAVKPGTGILTPQQVYGPCVNFVRPLGVPLVIAETSIADDRPDAARAAALDADLTYCSQNADVIRAVFLFDTNINKGKEGVGFMLSPAMEAVLKTHLAAMQTSSQ
jgi:hypothetical protein